MKNLKKYQRGIIAFCLVVSLAVPPSLVLSVGMSFVDIPLAYAAGEVPVPAPAGESSGAEQSFDPGSVGSAGSSGSSTTTSGGNIDYGPGGYIVDGALSAASGSDSNYSSDGSNYSSDGSNYSSDGSNYSSDGSNYSSDGSNDSSDGSNYSSDGSNYSSDGSSYSSDGSDYSSDGSSYSSDGSSGLTAGSSYASTENDSSALVPTISDSSTSVMAASSMLPVALPLTFDVVSTPDPNQFSQGLIPTGSGGTFIPPLVPFNLNGQGLVIMDAQGNQIPPGPFMGIVGPMQRIQDDQGRYVFYGDNFLGTYRFDWTAGTATLTGYDGVVTQWGGIRNYTSAELLDPANVSFDSDWRCPIVANIRGYRVEATGGVVRLMDTLSRPVRVSDPSVGTYMIDWKSRTATLTDNSGVVIKTWAYVMGSNGEDRETIVPGAAGFRTAQEAGGITHYINGSGDIFRTDTPTGTSKFLYDAQHHVIKQWNPAREIFDFVWSEDSGTGTWTLDHATSTRQVSGRVETRTWSAPNVLENGAIYTSANIGGALTQRIQYTDGRVEEFDDSGKLIRQVASDGRLTMVAIAGVGTYRINWSANTATLTDVNGRVTTWGGVSDVGGSGNDGRVLIVENLHGSFVSSRLTRPDGSYQDFNAQGEVITERTVAGDLITYDRSDSAHLKISVTTAATGETVTYENCYIPIASEIPTFPRANIPLTTHVGTISYVQVNDPNGGWYRKSFGTSLNDITRVDYSNGDFLVLGTGTVTVSIGNPPVETVYDRVTSVDFTVTGNIQITRSGTTETGNPSGVYLFRYDVLTYGVVAGGLRALEKQTFSQHYDGVNYPAVYLGRKTIYNYDPLGQLINYQATDYYNAQNNRVPGGVEMRTYARLSDSGSNWIERSVFQFAYASSSDTYQDIVTTYQNGSSTAASIITASYNPNVTPVTINKFVLTVNGSSWMVSATVMNGAAMNTGVFSDGDRVFEDGQQYTVLSYKPTETSNTTFFTKVYAVGPTSMSRTETVLKLKALALLDRHSMQGAVATYDPINFNRSYYDNQGRLTVQHTLDSYYGGANVRTLRRTYNPDGSDKTTVEYFRADSSGTRYLMNDVDANGVPLNYSYDVTTNDLIGVFDANVFKGNGLADGWDQGTLDPIRTKLSQGLSVTQEEWVTALKAALKVRMRASDYQAAYADPLIRNSLDTAEQALLQMAKVEGSIMTLSELSQLSRLNRRLLEVYYPQQIEKTHGPLVERIVRTYDEQGRLKKEVSRTLRNHLATGLGTVETVTLYEYPSPGVTVARTYSGTFEGETPGFRNDLFRTVRTTVSSHPTAGWRTESLETTVGGASPITVVRVVDDHGRTVTETGPNDRVLPNGVIVNSSFSYDEKGMLSVVQHRDAAGALLLEEVYSPDATFGFKSTLTRAERYIGGRLDSKTWYRLSRLHWADNERIPVKDIMILYANGVDRTVDKVLAFYYYRQSDIISQPGMTAYNVAYMALNDCDVATYSTNATTTAQSIVSGYQNQANFLENLTKESSYKFRGANLPGVSFPNGMVLDNTYTPYLPGGVEFRPPTRSGIYGPTSVKLGQTIYAAPMGTGTYVGYSNVVNSSGTTQVPFIYSFSVVSSLDPQTLPPGTVFTQYSVNGPRPGEILTIYYIQRTDVNLIIVPL